MKKPDLAKFLALSLLVYLEVLGLAWLLSLGAESAAPRSLNPFAALSMYFIWFLFGAALTISAVDPFPTSSIRVRVRYLFLHLFVLAASCSVLYGISVLVRPLTPDHPIMDFLATKGIRLNEFTIRFWIPSIAVFSCLHATLLAAFLEMDRPVLRYVLAATLSIVLRVFNKVAAYTLWKPLVTGVARLAYISLSFLGTILGFEPHVQTGGELPVVGIGRFGIAITDGCSGQAGISTFMIALVLIFVIQRERMDWVRTVTVAYIGTLLMYAANVLRIVILLLIGHYYDPVVALSFWHSQGSTVFYSLVILLIMGSTYRWMQQRPDTDKPETFRSLCPSARACNR